MCVIDIALLLLVIAILLMPFFYVCLACIYAIRIRWRNIHHYYDRNHPNHHVEAFK